MRIRMTVLVLNLIFMLIMGGCHPVLTERECGGNADGRRVVSNQTENAVVTSSLPAPVKDDGRNMFGEIIPPRPRRSLRYPLLLAQGTVGATNALMQCLKHVGQRNVKSGFIRPEL